MIHDDVAFPPVLSVGGCNCGNVHEDFERCYRAVQSKDARFDGWFVTAVLTTRIYCRPSCPVRPPFARNVRFYPTAAAAQRAGFRACKRCRPDASPGSPEWNVRGDVVARAMRLIADGTVDREGVGGPGRPPRLHHPPAGAAAAGRGRGRPAGAGPRATGTDRPGADRDHGPAVRRRRLRRRILQHPSVQRHRALRLRRAHRRRCAARDDHAPARPANSPGTVCLRLPVRTPVRLRAASSAIWRPARCPVARRSATAPTGAVCACRPATAIVSLTPAVDHVRLPCWCSTTSAT